MYKFCFHDGAKGMMPFESIYDQLADTGLAMWQDVLPRLIEQVKLSQKRLYQHYASVIMALPKMTPSLFCFDKDDVCIGEANDCDDVEKNILHTLLMSLKPWRKGPYSIMGMLIDSEWRSSLKWERIKHIIAPLEGRVVLDVGCNNGYFGFRMLPSHPKQVIGIDPTLLYVFQFYAISTLAGMLPLLMLPVRLEQLPYTSVWCDTIFSMGVLYHQRSPFDHLVALKHVLRDGGELVLETLVIDGPLHHVLVPGQRYAKMRNVWFIPSCLTMEAWLKRVGFINIRCVDVSWTTPLEQRATHWSTPESLVDFLDTHDRYKTIEGYAAPKRAIFLAEQG